MVIGTAVYEIEEGEICEDLPMGTVVDFFYNEEAGETRYRVRWDGDNAIDTYAYAEWELYKVKFTKNNEENNV